MRSWLPLAELLLVLGTVLVLALFQLRATRKGPSHPEPPREPPDRGVNSS